MNRASFRMSRRIGTDRDSPREATLSLPPDHRGGGHPPGALRRQPYRPGPKQAERRDYEAVLAGTPCTAVARAPSYVARASLKSLNFGGATFRYVRGDADCQTVRPGRLVNDTEVPFCLFDRPEFVEATAGATKASYVIAVGQASILVAPDGLRCAVKPSP